jgi:hypothetical protein
MRTLLAFFLALILADPQFVPTTFNKGSVATFSPTVISEFSSGVADTYDLGSNAPVSAPTLHMRLLQPFIGGANNCAVAVVHSGAGLTQLTPTDSGPGGDTFQAGPSVTLSSHLTLKAWYSFGTTAGTNEVDVTTSGSDSIGGDALGGFVTEIENCNTSALGPTGTMNTAATGSAINLTLGGAPTSGALVLSYFIDATSASTMPDPIANTATLTAGSGFTPITLAKSFGKVAEFDSSTTSTTVPVTYSGTNTILGVALTFNKGAAGNSPPGTKYIDDAQMENGPATTTPTYDFPCQHGNLVVGLVNSGGPDISSITGSSGTWASAVSEVASTTSQIVYGKAVTCGSSLTVSPTFNTTPETPGNVLFLISVANANSNPIDVTNTFSGNQTTAANWTNVTLTPSANGELSFYVSSIFFHTLTGSVTDANSHALSFIAAWDSKADDANSSCAHYTQASPLSEDNGYALFYNTSDHTQQTAIYSGTQVSGGCTTDPSGVGQNSAVAAAFN